MKIDKEFSHGGDLEAFKKEYNLESAIDLSSNINFLKPNIEIDFNSLDISSYPNYDKFYKSIAKHFGVKKSQIELYNGGSSAIFRLFEVLKPKHCTIYSPAYLEYKRVAKSLHVRVELLNRFKNLYKELKRGTFVVFVNPSTPDGKYYDLHRLFEIWGRADATVLIDESFLEFCDKKSCVEELRRYEKLYILKSMTKFYSSAGVRVGVVISNRKNIKKLKIKEPLWKLSSFDTAYLSEALKDKEFMRKTRKKIDKNRKFLEKILKKTGKFEKIYKSEANFLLAKLKNGTAKEFQKEIAKNGIMVRDCSNFDFLDERFVRIAVKSKRDMKSIFS